MVVHLSALYNIVLQPNYRALLLSQSVIKVSLHSVLLFFSIEGDLIVIALSLSSARWRLKMSDYPLVARRIFLQWQQ